MFSFLVYFFCGSFLSDGSISMYIATVDVYFRECDHGFADESLTLQAGQIFIRMSAM